MKTSMSVKGSPLGVMMAAETSSATIACRLYSRRRLFLKIPNRLSSHAKSGISKTMPITRTSIMKMSM